MHHHRLSYPYDCILHLLLLTILFKYTESSTNQTFIKLPLFHRTDLTKPETIVTLLDASVARYHSRVASTLSSTSSSTTASKSSTSNFRTSVRSGATEGSGQYFTTFALGTPPQRFILIADTGSDLVWVRCSICRRGKCSSTSEGTSPPTFQTIDSSTYRAIPCLSQDCLLVPAPASFSCNPGIPISCRFDYTYADGSQAVGIFSTETVRFGGDAGVDDVAFGCGVRSSGRTFSGSDGVLGLGRGTISLVSQISTVTGTNRFAYCLVDFFAGTQSSLVLGSAAAPVASLQYTELQSNPFAPSLYYVSVDEVRVNGEAVSSIPSDIWSIDAAGNGGVVLDTGTTLSLLLEPAYKEVLSAMAEALKLPQVDPVQSFDLCVNASGLSAARLASVLPKLAFVFSGGAVFEPTAAGNVFIEVPGGLLCLGVQGVEGPIGFSVLGNLIQQNFYMQFDNDNSRLGFAPTRCSP